MSQPISSLQNKSVKEVIKLQEKSRNRRKSGYFIVEGQREIGLAVKAGYQLDRLYRCQELAVKLEDSHIQAQTQNIVDVSLAVYRKMAYRKSTEGLLAVAQSKAHALKNISLSQHNPLILVAEAPEKPGNIGALLRTADAANVEAVFIANPRTDLYNPNIIRSSMGCLFTRQIAMASSNEIIRYLQSHKINIYCAALQASENYNIPNYKQATAIVVGTEADGLQDEWLIHSTQNIIIPMQGAIDSMNVSVAAGIVIFEAKRQRKFR